MNKLSSKLFNVANLLNEISSCYKFGHPESCPNDVSEQYEAEICSTNGQ